MYTIKQASLRSGVTVPLLRAWERRYGIVAPTRTPSGYRLYDDEAIAMLSAMRRLVDDGWTPSQAAVAVLGGGVGPSAAPSQAPPALERTGPATAGSGGGATETTALVEAASHLEAAALVEAAAHYDNARIEAILDALLARGSFEAVIDDLVLPAVAALGAGWAAGTLDIAAEHLATEAIRRRFAVLFDAASAPGTGRPVVVGLPPGNLHEIGTIAFAIALRRRGVDVLYLGPDVPIASWVHAVSGSAASAVVIGVARRADVAAARRVAGALHAARPETIVALGGPAAVAAAGEATRILPTRVTEAALELAGLVADAG